jgi:hypothetical protein
VGGGCVGCGGLNGRCGWGGQGQNTQSAEETDNILAFMRAIAVCHAVIPSVDEKTKSTAMDK